VDNTAFFRSNAEIVLTYIGGARLTHTERVKGNTEGRL